MVLPQALEFDQTPNRILLQKAEEARQQDMLRRKLEAENREKQYQILNEINPATLYGKFEKEVVDKSIGQLTGGIANYIKQNPNASYVDLQNQVNKGLSGVAQWSSRVKIAKDNIDKTINGMDNTAPFDKGRLRALAIDRALYKTDELGRKVFKSPEEIDTEKDIVSIVAKESPSKVIDPFKGQELAVKYITDSSLFTVDETKEVDTPNGKQTVITGRKATIPFYLEAKNGNVGVKKQANGYIDEMVFQRFNENPAISVWIESKAEDLINKSGVEKTPQNMEIFKRSFLTDWLEQNKKGAIENVDKNLYAKPSGVNINIGSGPGMKDGYIDAWSEVIRAVDSGGANPLNDLDSQISSKLLEIADNSSVFRTAKIKSSPELVTLKRDSKGNVRIYMIDKEGKIKGDGVLLSAQGVNRAVNSSLGKAENIAASSSEPTPRESSRKVYDPVTGKYIEQDK